MPKNKVAYVFLGKDNVPLLENSLKSLDINICSLEGDSRLDKRVASHTDILMLHLGSNHIVLSKFQGNFPFGDTKIAVSASNFSTNYPDDVALNAVIIGKNIICNKKHTDKYIIEYATDNNLNIIDVKQGYSKCSVVPSVKRSGYRYIIHRKTFCCMRRF